MNIQKEHNKVIKKKKKRVEAFDYFNPRKHSK